MYARARPLGKCTPVNPPADRARGFLSSPAAIQKMAALLCWKSRGISGEDIMRLVSRNAVWLFSFLFLLLGLGAATAADRGLSVFPQSDMPGGDYRVIKKVKLDQCQEACLGDLSCRAFTYNEKAKWCFLKGAAAEPVAFKGATSGTIAADAVARGHRHGARARPQLPRHGTDRGRPHHGRRHGEHRPGARGCRL